MMLRIKLEDCKFRINCEIAETNNKPVYLRLAYLYTHPISP